MTTTAEPAGELATTVVELAGVFHPQLGKEGLPGAGLEGPAEGFGPERVLCLQTRPP